jgi:hypothetical protein
MPKKVKIDERIYYRRKITNPKLLLVIKELSAINEENTYKSIDRLIQYGTTFYLRTKIEKYENIKK